MLRGKNQAKLRWDLMAFRGSHDCPSALGGITLVTPESPEHVRSHSNSILIFATENAYDPVENLKKYMNI